MPLNQLHTKVQNAALYAAPVASATPEAHTQKAMLAAFPVPETSVLPVGVAPYAPQTCAPGASTTPAFTDVFERKETKYKLTAEQYSFLQSALEPYMEPDTFGCNKVTSIYYDTNAYELIGRSLEHPLYKEKLRLRGYGVHAWDGRVYVELKKKFKGIVYKRRVGMSYDAASAYLRGMPFEQACAAYPLENAELDAESHSWRSLQIAHEIDAFQCRYARLTPSLAISCWRTAWAPRTASFAETQVPTTAGAAAAVPTNCLPANALRVGAARAEAPTAHNPFANVRITFDEEVAYRCMRDGQGVQGKQLLLDDGMVVMEVKTQGAYPLELSQLLAFCHAYPSSFSKYGTAYEHLCQHALSNRRKEALC